MRVKRVCPALLASVALGAVGASAAAASVTPGWECIPTTAGQAVTSGGTGASPSCSAGTPVLAPTYVASGVGGKPTVEFANVNVQVVSGSGSTNGTVNGEGNLVVGYAADTSGLSETGSNNLIVGSDLGWTGYGSLVTGYDNNSTGAYTSVFGTGDKASGKYTLAAGADNSASGSGATVTGGMDNTASGAEASVTGGDYNESTGSWANVSSGCDNIAGPGKVPTGPCTSSGSEGILGGASNDVTGVDATISGGQSDTSSGAEASVSGGLGNVSSSLSSSVTGGYDNNATSNQAEISGGGHNTASGEVSSVVGGYYNSSSQDESVAVGGCSNYAGGGVVSIVAGCKGFGDSFQTILGGIGNSATALDSTISGGEVNQVLDGAGAADAVAGGYDELLTSSSDYLSEIGASPFNP